MKREPVILGREKAKGCGCGKKKGKNYISRCYGKEES